MAAARRVGVREFIDQGDLRPPGDQPVEIHLLEPLPLCSTPLAGVISRPSSSASVSLRPWVSTTPMTTSEPSRFRARPLLQHLVGLADAGGGADKDLQLAGTALLAPGRFQQASGSGLCSVSRRWSAITRILVWRFGLSEGLNAGRTVERHVQCQYVDSWFAKDAEPSVHVR